MKSTRINYWKSFENHETIVWTICFPGKQSHMTIETNIAQESILSWAIFVSIILWLEFPPEKCTVQTIASQFSKLFQKFILFDFIFAF